MPKSKGKTLKHHTADSPVEKPIDGNIAVMENPPVQSEEKPATEVVKADIAAIEQAIDAELLTTDGKPLIEYDEKGEISRVAEHKDIALKAHHVSQNMGVILAQSDAAGLQKRYQMTMAQYAPYVRNAVKLWLWANKAAGVQTTDWVIKYLDPTCPKDQVIAQRGYHPHIRGVEPHIEGVCLNANYSYGWVTNCIKAANAIDAEMREDKARELADLQKVFTPVLTLMEAEGRGKEVVDIKAISDPTKYKEVMMQTVEALPETIEVAPVLEKAIAATGLSFEEAPKAESDADVKSAIPQIKKPTNFKELVDLVGQRLTVPPATTPRTKPVDRKPMFRKTLKEFIGYITFETLRLAEIDPSPKSPEKPKADAINEFLLVELIRLASEILKDAGLKISKDSPFGRAVEAQYNKPLSEILMKKVGKSSTTVTAADSKKVN